MYHLSCSPDCNQHPVTGHEAASYEASQTAAEKARLLWIALCLIGGFALVELAVGWWSHSLALLAESGHMLSDTLALGLALFATWVARLPATPQATFGYRRIEILAALVNGVGLMGIAVWIAWEAIAYLQSPPVEILSLPMLMTAIVGLGINSLSASLLHSHSHHDLNLRGAFLHMVADAVSSVGVILAAIAVWLFQWNWADGAMSLGVAILVGLGTLPLIRQSLHILLEKTPVHLNLAQIQQHLQSFEGVVSVERLRVWTIALGQEALSAHLTVGIQDGLKRDRLLENIQASLQPFGIADVFLQMTAPTEPINLSSPPKLELIRVSVPEALPPDRDSLG
ncbi:MAG: cation diffusion facilitator family transporter [Drouetiella hepatica Uher 2000/2452]|jgi:cobalt-zinc-cadmium efflux system protein|uniref:Cation diffusion facilitator family transporter n=1 Tax=Drouetiella hepatica Uher 2000/2452 TaxID=904376 RepID=A0A951ULX1_9CYAN|nr:cation diffusion facilitator family transporter [Drouetiella hepatica Uher 2000/2452]